MSRPNAPPLSRPDLAVRPLVAVAAVKLLTHLLLADEYGFHRDELYYLVCGRRLAWGYVDHPPLTALLARAVETLAGPSLVALRALAAVCGSLIVFASGALARELGGRTWAQLLTAVTVLMSPVFLLTNGLYQTVTLDQLLWVVGSLLLARIFSTDDHRLWLLFGLLVGVGLLTKYTVVLFVTGLALGLLVSSQRRQLQHVQLWLGLLLGVLVCSPNLLWQARHEWPALEFIANSGARAAAEFPPPLFLSLQLVFVGVISVPVLAAGLAFLFGRQGRPFRPLGWVLVVVIGLLAIRGAKPYYPAPSFPAVLAAGAVWLEALARRRDWRRLRLVVPCLIVVGNLPTLWISLPIVPRAKFAAHQQLWPHREFHEMFGWQELVTQVADVYGDLDREQRPGAGILTDAYGEAAAIEVLGSQLGLPRPASGHDSYFFWGAPDSQVVVAVAWSRAYLEDLFEEVLEVRQVSNRWGIRNQAAAKSIFVCRRPRQPWAELWAGLRSFI